MPTNNPNFSGALDADGGEGRAGVSAAFGEIPESPANAARTVNKDEIRFMVVLL
jgi:hypothetical protein